MNTKPPVKLIKRRERTARQRRATVKEAVGPKRWSATVRSWVTDSQQQDRSESLPAFDSLFKDALPESGHAD